MNFEYTGAPGDIESPTVSLVDGTGHKFECLKYGLSAAPGETNVPHLTDPDFREKQKDVNERLNWVDPIPRSFQKKPRSLKSGERFYVVYSFEDPKDDENLKLRFNDADPLPLKVQDASSK
jgi:hypothetical protein